MWGGNNKGLASELLIKADEVKPPQATVLSLIVLGQARWGFGGAEGEVMQQNNGRVGHYGKVKTA